MGTDECQFGLRSASLSRGAPVSLDRRQYGLKGAILA